MHKLNINCTCGKIIQADCEKYYVGGEQIRCECGKDYQLWFNPMTDSYEVM